MVESLRKILLDILAYLKNPNWQFDTVKLNDLANVTWEKGLLALLNGDYYVRDDTRAIKIREHEAGVTDAIAIDSTGVKTGSISFTKTFKVAPVVVLCFREISDNAADLVNLNVVSVSTSGFTWSFKVNTAGGAGATCRIAWLAMEP